MRNILLVTIALMTPVLGGCLSDVTDTIGLTTAESEGGLPEAETKTSARVLIAMTTAGGRGADVHTLPLKVETVSLVAAAGTEVPLVVSTGDLDLVAAGASGAAVASGKLLGGAYKAVRFTLADRAPGHTVRGAEEFAVATQTALDAPFTIRKDAENTVIVTIDLDRSIRETTDGPVVAPALASLVVKAGADTVSEHAVEAPLAPIARMQVFGGDGAKLYESDFVAASGRTTIPGRTGEAVTFIATTSEAREAAASLVQYYWDFDDGGRAEGRKAEHVFAEGGIHKVRVVAEDSAGEQDDLVVEVEIEYAYFPEPLLASDMEGGAQGWQTWTTDDIPDGDIPPGTGPGVLTQWQLIETQRARSGSSAWYAGIDEALYTDNARATLLSPAVAIPDDFTWAGLRFFIRGQSSQGSDLVTAGGDFLTVEFLAYDDGGEADAEWQELIVFRGPHADWRETFTAYGLSEHAGKNYQLRFTFRSDLIGYEGHGFYVDDVTIGGSSEPLKNMADGVDGHAHH